MRRIAVIALLLIAGISSGLILARSLGTTVIDGRRFVTQLRQDSMLIDGQWRWREIYPGRDSMEYARLLMDRNNQGFFSSITGSPENRIDWISDSGWSGQVFRDNEVPPPHVYSVVLRAPYALPADVQPPLIFGEALLAYGSPRWSYYVDGSTRSICFRYGVCATVD
ncbi:MAG: hypothetical protein KF726_20780, partial [Anaerolineae bacterium]|nr:hypothetical protein [Anaerolineae bacterium]